MGWKAELLVVGGAKLLILLLSSPTLLELEAHVTIPASPCFLKFQVSLMCSTGVTTTH